MNPAVCWMLVNVLQPQWHLTGLWVCKHTGEPFCCQASSRCHCLCAVTPNVVSKWCLRGVDEQLHKASKAAMDGEHWLNILDRCCLKALWQLLTLVPSLLLVWTLQLFHARERLHQTSSMLLQSCLQDIIRVRRAEGSLRDRVEDHMTCPAVTVGPKMSVRQAAKIMLQQRIRRLPVVDGNGQAIG